MVERVFRSETGEFSGNRFMEADQAEIRIGEVWFCKQNRLVFKGLSRIINKFVDLALIGFVSGEAVDVDEDQQPITSAGAAWLFADLRDPEFEPGCQCVRVEWNPGELARDGLGAVLLPVRLECRSKF